MKRIAIYCRVSSDEQKDKDTIDNQVDILNTYIEMKEGLKKTSEYLDDGVSGTVPFMNRTNGKRLIDDAKKGLFDSILVWKVDRFGRDTLSGLTAVELLRSYNIEIISVTEPFDLNTPAGRFQFITYLNMAELERNNILDRMFLGATRAAKKGKWLGGIVPYGYYVNKDKYLEINEYEAIVIRKIFDLYITDSLSTLDIAIFLNNTGIDCNYASRGTGKMNSPTKKSLWSPSTIQRILTNTTYMGIHEYGKKSSRRKETIIREVPYIIPVEVFDKATSKRKENLLFSKRNSPNRIFLLRTLIKCGECGHSYFGVFYKSRNSVYTCRGKKSFAKKLYNVKCSNMNVNADALEEYIWNQCKNILLNYDNYKIDEEKNNLELSLETEKEKLLHSLNNIELEKNNILKLYRKNIISEEDLEKQLAEIRIESDKVKEILALNNDKLSSLHDKKNLIVKNETFINYYKNRINELNTSEKLLIIRFFIKEITITNKIVDCKREPHINIVWNMSDLLFEPSRITGCYKQKI